jgi:RimJ/RimL family protein N-acetyltransferase
VIRHARADEAQRLRELRLTSLSQDPDAFGSTYERDAAMPESRWREWAEKSEEGSEQRTFVVVDGADRWLGLALVRADDEAPGDAVLNAMWVAPAARGKGAAKALCHACAAWARERGYRALNVAVVVGNEPARRAYEAAGFIRDHTITWTGEGRTLEELILKRPLWP